MAAVETKGGENTPLKREEVKKGTVGDDTGGKKDDGGRGIWGTLAGAFSAQKGRAKKVKMRLSYAQIEETVEFEVNCEDESAVDVERELVLALERHGVYGEHSLSENQTSTQLHGAEFHTCGGAAPKTAVIKICSVLPLRNVQRLVLDDGTLPFLIVYSSHWTSLTSLTLTHGSLTELPLSVCCLSKLESLNISNNKLSSIPARLGQLSSLRTFNADDNLLSTLPMELCECSHLRTLSVTNNKISKLVLDFKNMPYLEALYLMGNAIRFVSELGSLTKLAAFSILNMKIHGNEEGLVVVTVEESSTYSIMGTERIERDRYAGFFNLVFQHAMLSHPLLSGAVSELCRTSAHARKAVLSQPSGLQQLLSHSICGKKQVVHHVTNTLRHLAAESSSNVDELIQQGVTEYMLQLLRIDLNSQPEAASMVLDSLNVVREIAKRSESSADSLRRELLIVVHKLAIGGAGDILEASKIQAGALDALGSFAVSNACRRYILSIDGIRTSLARIIRERPETRRQSLSDKVPEMTNVQFMSAKLMALLGEQERLSKSLGRLPVHPSGVRVLSLDGGGMRGLATIRIIKHLEELSGKKLADMFDLITGTSTGCLVSTALICANMSHDECKEMYLHNIGEAVFGMQGDSTKSSSSEGTGGAGNGDSAAGGSQDTKAAGEGTAQAPGKQRWWISSLAENVVKSGEQSVRMAVRGSKHSVEKLEEQIKKLCNSYDSTSGQLIESQIMGAPFISMVSTLVSTTPPRPFVFRNYQFQEGAEESAGIKAYMGSCTHEMWKALRATSAAPYYLAEFNDGDLKFHDGAVCANNPSLVAFREARLLFPDTPIKCLLSIGTGEAPIKKRPPSSSTYLEIGNVLFESAAGLTTPHEALEQLAPLISPKLTYRRLQPIDDRCDVELDETDPESLKRLEEATDEYIEKNAAAFEELVEILNNYDEDDAEVSIGAVCPTGTGSSISMGRRGSISIRKGVAIIESQPFLQHRRRENETHKLIESKCKPGQVPCVLIDSSIEISKRLEDGVDISNQGCTRSNEEAIAGAVIRAALRNTASSCRVIHLDLSMHDSKLVLYWCPEIFAVVEPSTEAKATCAKATPWDAEPSTQCKHKTSLASLCAQTEELCIDRNLINLVGRHRQPTPNLKQTMETFVFQRSKAAAFFDTELINDMVGLWTGRVIILSALLCDDSLVTTLLACGASAVFARIETPDPAELSLEDVEATYFFNYIYDGLLKGADPAEVYEKFNNKDARSSFSLFLP